MCGYEMASAAVIPKCSNCGSRKFNPIEEFSATKSHTKEIEIQEENQMVKKEEKKPAEKKEEKEDNQATNKNKKSWGSEVDKDLGF